MCAADTHSAGVTSVSADGDGDSWRVGNERREAFDEGGGVHRAYDALSRVASIFFCSCTMP